MKAKNCLIFGGSGQIGRHLIRKLTKNNYRVTVVTRNIHQKGHIIKTQGNAGFVNIVEANIFDETKIKKLFEETDICINLIGILFEKRGTSFKNIHTVFPSILAKLCKQYNVKHFIHLSALGINEAIDSKYAKTKMEGEQGEGKVTGNKGKRKGKGKDSLQIGTLRKEKNKERERSLHRKEP